MGGGGGAPDNWLVLKSMTGFWSRFAHHNCLQEVPRKKPTRTVATRGHVPCRHTCNGTPVIF